VVTGLTWRVSASHSCGSVDHAAEDPPTLHRRGQRHDDRLVLIGWPLLPGLVWPVPAVVADVKTGGSVLESHRARFRWSEDI
jgi:hypothetical protein